MGNALWSPAALAPGVWLDDSTAVTYASGVITWDNAGSIAGDFRQITPSRHPLAVEKELNGRRILRFDGVDDMLSSATTAAGDLFRNKAAGWFFFVAKKRGVDPASQTAPRVLMYVPTANGATRVQIQAGGVNPNANRHVFAARRLDAEGAVSAVGPVLAAEWFISRSAVAWNSGKLEDYVNGNLVASATLPSAGNTSDTAGGTGGLEIGGNGGVNPADIDLACAIAGSSGMPSQADFQRLEGWAAHRYGLTANLPSDHPYKTTPPYAGPIITVRGAYTTDEFRGPGRVFGDTGVEGNPNDVPIGARTTLLRARDHHPVQRVWSNNATGAFEFKGVRLDEDYLVIAEHPDGSFNPVAADRVRAEPMG